MSIQRRSWTEFQQAGLLWWVNRMLHLFGWCVVFEFDDDGNMEVYPALTDMRGFTPDSDADGFVKLTNHLRDNAGQLVHDVVGEPATPR